MGRIILLTFLIMPVSARNASHLSGMIITALIIYQVEIASWAERKWRCLNVLIIRILSELCRIDSVESYLCSLLPQGINLETHNEYASSFVGRDWQQSSVDALCYETLKSHYATCQGHCKEERLRTWWSAARVTMKKRRAVGYTCISAFKAVSIW